MPDENLFAVPGLPVLWRATLRVDHLAHPELFTLQVVVEKSKGPAIIGRERSWPASGEQRIPELLQRSAAQFMSLRAPADCISMVEAGHQIAVHLAP